LLVHPNWSNAEYSDNDRFVPPVYGAGKDPFCKNVKDISELKALIGIRRKSMNYYRTQLRQILNGKPLNGETMTM
jgi:hypothetical protein